MPATKLILVCTISGISAQAVLALAYSVVPILEEGRVCIESGLLKRKTTPLHVFLRERGNEYVHIASYIPTAKQIEILN